VKDLREIMEGRRAGGRRKLERIHVSVGAMLNWKIVGDYVLSFLQRLINKIARLKR